MTQETIQLRDDCYHALRCLYIELPAAVANDVNKKVKAYIDHLCEHGTKLAVRASVMEVALEFVVEGRTDRDRNDLACLLRLREVAKTALPKDEPTQP